MPDDVVRDEVTPAVEGGSPTAPEELFAALRGEPQEPETSAERAPEATEAEPDLAAQLEKLRARLGTDDDVNVVKSQRDKLRYQLEQYQQQAQAQVQSLAQRLAQLEQTQVQGAYQQWEAQWQAYLAAAPDDAALQRRTQEYTQARQLAQQQIQAQARERELAQREQAVHQTDAERAQQAMIDFTTSVYENVAEELGLDKSKLSKESYSALRNSFTEEVKRIKEAADGQGQKFPTPPQRHGRVGPRRDTRGWFEGLIAQGDFDKIEDAFRIAKQSQGLKLEDIISR